MVPINDQKTRKLQCNCELYFVRPLSKFNSSIKRLINVEYLRVNYVAIAI